MTEILDRIRGALVGLKMPRALEALDHTMQKLEQGKISGIEALDALLSEEYATRETRRIDVALKTAKLLPIKTLEGFDFSFQPSLDRERIAALAQLDFIRRAEVVHFLGPPGTDKSAHLSLRYRSGHLLAWAEGHYNRNSLPLISESAIQRHPPQGPMRR